MAKEKTFSSSKQKTDSNPTHWYDIPQEKLLQRNKGRLNMRDHKKRKVQREEYEKSQQRKAQKQ